MTKHIFVCALAALFLCLPYGAIAEGPATRGEFIRQLAESMGVVYKLGQNPDIAEYAALLRSEGIKIPAGYDVSRIISPEEKADMLSQALGMERKKKETGKAVVEVYRNKAVITDIKGKVEVKRAGSTVWNAAEINMVLAEGDYIKTEKNSSVFLRVGMAGKVVIKENTELLLKTLTSAADSKSENILLYLAMGEMFVDVRGLSEKSKFETHTPTTVAAVRGTTYIVEVEPVLGKTQVR